MMPRLCSILFDAGYGGASPSDCEGCRLPSGHDGPHEFVDTTGVAWQWETDWECDCETCREGEGDYCSIFWRKVS